MSSSHPASILVRAVITGFGLRVGAEIAKGLAEKARHWSNRGQDGAEDEAGDGAEPEDADSEPVEDDDDDMPGGTSPDPPVF